MRRQRRDHSSRAGMKPVYSAQSRRGSRRGRPREISGTGEHRVVDARSCRTSAPCQSRAGCQTGCGVTERTQVGAPAAGWRLRPRRDTVGTFRPAPGTRREAGPGQGRRDRGQRHPQSKARQTKASARGHRQQRRQDVPACRRFDVDHAQGAAGGEPAPSPAAAGHVPTPSGPRHQRPAISTPTRRQRAQNQAAASSAIAADGALEPRGRASPGGRAEGGEMGGGACEAPAMAAPKRTRARHVQQRRDRVTAVRR